MCVCVCVYVYIRGVFVTNDAAATVEREVVRYICKVLKVRRCNLPYEVIVSR